MCLHLRCGYRDEKRTRSEHSRFLGMREFNVTTKILQPGKWFCAQLLVLFVSFSIVLITWSLGFVLIPNFTHCRENPGHETLKLKVLEQEFPQELEWERKGKRQLYVGWCKNELEKPCWSGIQWEECRKMLCIYYLLCCERVLKRFNLGVYGRDLFPSGIFTSWCQYSSGTVLLFFMEPLLYINTLNMALFCSLFNHWERGEGNRGDKRAVILRSIWFIKWNGVCDSQK